MHQIVTVKNLVGCVGEGKIDRHEKKSHGEVVSGKQRLAISASMQTGGKRSGLVSLGGSSRGAGICLLDVLLGGQESRADNSAVQELGALSLGQHQPYDGQRLEGVVPGDIVQHDIDERLEEREHAKDDPVSEPLNVILGRRALQRLEREVGRDKEANQVGEESSSTDGETSSQRLAQECKNAANNLHVEEDKLKRCTEMRLLAIPRKGAEP